MSEAVWRILDEGNAALLLADPDGTVIAGTAACTAILGVPPEKMIGVRVWSLMPQLQAIEVMAELADSGKYRQSVMLNGTAYLCHLVSIAAEPERGFVLQILDATSDSAVSGAARRSGEREILEALGRLGGKLGHDLNNIFGSMRGCIDLIKRKVDKLSPQENPVQKQISLLESALQKGVEISTAIRGYVRAGEFDTGRLHLGAVISSVVSRLNDAGFGPDNFEITITDDPEIEASEFAVSELLYGLCMNAIDAMRNLSDRQVVVFLEYVDLTEDFGDELPAGKYLRLSVMDHGKGITEREAEHLFEPFFSTRPAEIGKGVGLSLAMSREIMRKHGGDLLLFSEPSCGTVAHCFFPVRGN